MFIRLYIDAYDKHTFIKDTGNKFNNSRKKTNLKCVI